MRRVLWIVLLGLVSCSEPEQPLLAAATSLVDVMPELAPDARGTFAASSTLARQIERGLAADVFVSADRAWVDHLVKRGHGRAPVAVAGNELVCWVRPGGPKLGGPGDLAGLRVAVGSPEVPVGRYARAALGSLDIRPVNCRNAHAVMRTLALGEADAAIGYATDGGPGLVVAFRFDVRVRYWALVCRDRPEAHALLARVRSAADVWRRFGFVPEP